MRILFLHGWSSTGSAKSAFLRSLGHDVLTPRLSNWSFRRAVRTAQKALDQFRPAVVVGSSRGGAVAMNMETDDTPLILLAPAWRRFGRANRVKPSSIIIHSLHDDTIPFSDSLRLSSQSPDALLLAAGQDHRLNCPQARKALAWALESLVGNCRITNRETQSKKGLDGTPGMPFQVAMSLFFFMM
ncbi:MAG: alpha/beta hydrolase [Gemmataceae bacterium]|nr:alpha/beta hydrolase [Gemmataceae bacterium]